MTGNVSSSSPFDGGISRYLVQIRRFALLDAGLEYELAKRCREADDEAAAQSLVNSHLRLAAKIAFEYRGYGLPLSDLISEGNLGMLQAVKRFDPDRGSRFATYASWWIRAQIHSYLLRSRSLVKMGTTPAQKRLFFNLQRLKAQMHMTSESNLSPAQVGQIASALHVPRAEVVSMNGRMSAPDASLNLPAADGDGEWQDRIADEVDDQEKRLAEQETRLSRRALMRQALASLNSREQEVIAARHLREKPLPLALLAGRYDVSPERVRQIEMRALKKLQKVVQRLSDSPPGPMSPAFPEAAEAKPH
jgi:RNA polymerase sigma-32 factor